MKWTFLVTQTHPLDNSFSLVSEEEEEEKRNEEDELADLLDM